MTSLRARELRLLSSRAASDQPPQARPDTPAALADGDAGALSSPARRPLPPVDAQRLRRAAFATLGLGGAAVAVLLTAVVAGLPLLPAGIAAGVLLTAGQAVPLVVHALHRREVRRRGGTVDTAGHDPGGPLDGTAA